MKRPEPDSDSSSELLKPTAGEDTLEPSRKKQKKRQQQQNAVMENAFTAATTSSKNKTPGTLTRQDKLPSQEVENVSTDSDTGVPPARIPTSVPKNKDKVKGVRLKTGRVRLPDKLMEYLNCEVAPKVLFWQDDGLSFSFDINTAQTELLDKYFDGTKLTSFTRSLNRWGFKRVFHALSPKNVLSYEHPSFLRDQPERVKELNMANANDHAYAKVNPHTHHDGTKNAKDNHSHTSPSLAAVNAQYQSSDTVHSPPLAPRPTSTRETSESSGAEPTPTSYSSAQLPPANAVTGLLELALGGHGNAHRTGQPPANAALDSTTATTTAPASSTLSPSAVHSLLAAIMGANSAQTGLSHLQSLAQSQPQPQPQPQMQSSAAGPNAALLASLSSMLGGTHQQQHSHYYQQQQQQQQQQAPNLTSLLGQSPDLSQLVKVIIPFNAWQQQSQHQQTPQQQLQHLQQQGPQQQLESLLQAQGQGRQQQQQQPVSQWPQPAAAGSSVQNAQQSIQSAIQSEQQRQAALQMVMGMLSRNQNGGNSNNNGSNGNNNHAGGV